MTTTDTLRVALAELATVRDDSAKLRARLATARADFDATHAALLGSISEYAAREAEAENLVRSLTLTCYDLTGEKKPAEGASVVIRTTYSYDDADALAWAETALPTAIHRVLDTKVVDKIASTGVLPFATKVETPSVRIATDLTLYLPVADAAVEVPF
jgi:hypothetical protein